MNGSGGTDTLDYSGSAQAISLTFQANGVGNAAGGDAEGDKARGKAQGEWIKHRGSGERSTGGMVGTVYTYPYHPFDVVGWDGCLYPNASVTVMVTDSCPCAHWNPSNKRHCCGPQRHVDLSFWAFEKIARHEFGVIDVEYKRVACPDMGVRMAKC